MSLLFAWMQLVEQDSKGQCNSECKTIDELVKRSWGIRILIGACSKKPPKVPEDRIPGEPFVPKSSKEAEMEKIPKSMEGMPGAPGMKMYSKEDLMNTKNFGDDDVDEEDDEDEAQFPSNLGKVLREKENKKDDWTRRITKGILNAGETVKNHANKVSHRIRKWWKAKKAVLNKKNSNAKKSEL
ncbi:unnamed protein product [Coffea canephora]|uniref:Uncharacterized protein n=1 Tax=Coffea canephora TaxID=49390 RepID=A0A068V0Y4_COFCA|nr:unnamed protein product [Coffea canephora]